LYGVQYILMTLSVFFGQPSHHQDTSSIHNASLNY
jgi:hypothetical protein